MKKLVAIIFISAIFVSLILLFKSFHLSATQPKESQNFLLQKETFQAQEPVHATILNTQGPIKASVYSSEGERVDFPISKETHNGNTEITVSPPQSFKPGKYTLEVDDGNGNISKQNFSWGVLAINTNKSVYIPKEQAKLHFAVLDEQGKMVCNARLTLKIKTPAGNSHELSTNNSSIKVNQECLIKDYVEKPDYEAVYETDGPGEYMMTLTASSKNGTFTIQDSFEVQENRLFDVERIAHTRIFPINKYPVFIDITAQQDFSGAVSEKVPLSYKITPHSASISSPQISANASTSQQILTWNVSIKKGQTIRLAYIYDAPDISPQFHLLGHVWMYQGENIIYEESRKWQIAVDDIVTIDSTLHSNDNAYTNGSPVVVFTDSNNGYVFYKDSTGHCGYSKTTNGGASWSFGGNVFNNSGCFKVAVWYDQWTPADNSGTIIHILGHTGSADLLYTTLDTSTDTIGDTATITDRDDDGSSPSPGANGSYSPGLTKATNGTVYAAWSASNDSYVLMCSTTCTTASNWSEAGSNPLDTTSDYTILMPLSTTNGTIAINGNIMMIRWDTSTDDMESIIFTASGESWSSWTTIDSDADDETDHDGSAFGATLNKDTNAIYLAYADTEFSGVIETRRFSNGSWNTTTDAVPLFVQTKALKIARNENNGAIYLSYIAGDNAVYQVVSTDEMNSWESFNQITSPLGFLYNIQMNITSKYRIYATYFKSDVDDLFGVDIASFQPQGGTTYWEGINIEGLKIN